MNKDLGSSRASPAAPLRQQRSRIPLAVSRLRKSDTKVTSDAEGGIMKILSTRIEEQDTMKSI